MSEKPAVLSRAEIRSDDSVLKAGTSTRPGKPGTSDMHIHLRDLILEGLTGVTCDNHVRYGKLQCDKLRDTRDGLLEINRRNVCRSSLLRWKTSWIQANSKEVRLPTARTGPP